MPGKKGLKAPAVPALYLVDASSYLYRAFFAIREHLSTRDGFPTKAVFGITNMLVKVLREKDPEFMAMVWDAPGKTFRHDLYPKYKANRPPMPEELSRQIPHVREIVSALGLVQVEVKGYEADDLIATISRRHKEGPVVIVSGDKDLLQLLGPEVTLWDPMKDEVVDEATVRERFGLPPQALRDVQALSGDPTDNVPGCPGVGPKTAIKLIQTYGSLDTLLERLDELPKGKLAETLRQEKSSLPLWRRLVGLAEDAPVPVDSESYRRQPPDRKRLKEIFERFELARFLTELGPGKAISFEEYELVQDRGALEAWAAAIREKGWVAVDTETTSEFPLRASLVGISICASPPAAAYVPVGHETSEAQIPLATVREVLAPILADPAVRKVGQNIKYDLLVLQRHGMGLAGIEGDTMIASYLLNPSRRQHNLGEIAQEYLGHRMTSFREVTADQKRIKNFARVPLALARDYSCEDAHVTALAADILWKRLREDGLWDLFKEVEIPLLEVLARMEKTGILVDRAVLMDLSREFGERLGVLEEEIHTLAGGPFNINSPQQLAEVLFVRCRLPQIKKTRKKTGYSTDVEVLTELARHHPLPERILAYRNLQKLKSTYADGLLAMIDPNTGRIHTSFNQTVTATGRLSSSEPNLQNIPVRTEEGRRIRAVFTAPEGSVLVSADYSQIDLRVLAHYSRDPALVSAFHAGEDIHTRTASEVFGVAPGLVTPEMRRVAKTVNFGIVYGMSAFGLSKELGIGRREAQAFIDRYFSTYPGVKRYMEEVVAAAREKGFVTTILGRRRAIPDIASPVKNVREFAERTAINTPIQGTAADIIKVAMLRVDKALRERGLEARILLQVHDELVIEVPAALAGDVSDLLKDAMENAMELIVPLSVSVKQGPDWASLEDL